MPVEITLMVVAYFCNLIIKIVEIVDLFSRPTKRSNANVQCLPSPNHRNFPNFPIVSQSIMSRHWVR